MAHSVGDLERVLSSCPPPIRIGSPTSPSVADSARRPENEAVTATGRFSRARDRKTVVAGLCFLPLALGLLLGAGLPSMAAPLCCCTGGAACLKAGCQCQAHSSTHEDGCLCVRSGRGPGADASAVPFEFRPGLVAAPMIVITVSTTGSAVADDDPEPEVRSRSPETPPPRSVTAR
jgi:hypothetical protein